MRPLLTRSRAAAFVAAVVLATVVAVAPQAGAITSGQYDGIAHPNIGAVFQNDVPFYVNGTVCSGSLLSPTEFLTAGHCTALLDELGLDPSQISVSFDEVLGLSNDLVLSSQHEVAVTSWTTHPEYRCTPNLCRNDVGVIHLATSVDMTPISLPSPGFLDAQATKGGLHDQAFVKVGYGVNSLDRSWFSPQANWTWEHRRMWTTSPFSSLTPDSLDTGAGGCYGDSGSPAFYGDSNLAVATASTGDMPCRAHDVYQRLDTQPVLDFLDEYR